MTQSDGIAFVDLVAAIAASDPSYADHDTRSRLEMRAEFVAWSVSRRRLYVAVADAFVFWSDDGGAAWHEVPEINRDDRGLPLARGVQHVGAIVETTSGTVVVIGRDRRDGRDRGVVWRMPADADRFVRTVAVEEAWSVGRAGNAVAGYMGNPPVPMVVVAPYATPAHLFHSIDDGRSWTRQDLADLFETHSHEVYLHRSVNPERTARLWVSGGDDPSGARSGVATFDRIEADGSLGGARFVLRESPGYRLVGLAGDGKHVYAGNESIAGGALRILDNAQSIDLCDFEYVLGKHRHDYHQFRAMVATPDGLLAAATDSYAFISDTIRADSGGYLYLSADGGASFREISLGMKWIKSIAYDGSSFWIVGGMNREDGVELSDPAQGFLRVPKACASASASPYCAKVVLADSSGFYAMAGYASHPRARLAPGQRTFRVDLSPYASIVVDIEAYGEASVVVEALPFQTWHPDDDAWRDVATIHTADGRATLQLPPAATHNRWFRVRNAGDAAVEFKRIAFVSRR